jgi:hypothetical protein
MDKTKQTEIANKKPFLKKVALTALFVGTLDIIAAIIQTLLYGGQPLKMLQYIASGLTGPESFSGGLSLAFLGLGFHYIIAFFWTAPFFWVYPRLTFLSKNKVLSGIGYGLFIWLTMNLIVLPLSNVPSSPFNITGAIIGTLILIMAVGLPLSFLAHRYYNK